MPNWRIRVKHDAAIKRSAKCFMTPLYFPRPNDPQRREYIFDSATGQWEALETPQSVTACSPVLTV